MRIETYAQVSQLYNANKTKKSNKPEQANGRDSLEISDFGSAYRVAKQAVSQSESVRTDRIEEIRAQMAAGTYNVPIEDVAGKLAERLLG